MARIEVDRTVIIPAGQPSSGLTVQPIPGGGVMLEVLHEGVRVRVALDPTEAPQVGVGIIASSAVARLTAAPHGRA